MDPATGAPLPQRKLEKHEVEAVKATKGEICEVALLLDAHNSVDMIGTQPEELVRNKINPECSNATLRDETCQQSSDRGLWPVVVDTSPTQSSSDAPSSNADDDDSELHTTPMTSNPPSECGMGEIVSDVFSSSVKPATERLSELYAENIVAKVIRTSQSAIGALPAAFPEIVQQDKGHDGAYSLREADFWTCGFFPGTLYSILERCIKYPQSLHLPSAINLVDFSNQLETLCRVWTEPIRGMHGRTDTHDIGFIVMPALRADWELFGDTRSLSSIVKAAKSLATRYVSSARAIRSWDLLKKKDIEILDQEDNMIVIIDSMCNLDSTLR